MNKKVFIFILKLHFSKNSDFGHTLWDGIKSRIKCTIAPTREEWVLINMTDTGMKSHPNLSVTTLTKHYFNKTDNFECKPKVNKANLHYIILNLTDKGDDV